MKGHLPGIYRDARCPSGWRTMARWSAGPIDKPLGRNGGPRLERKAVDRMPVIGRSGIQGRPMPANTPSGPWRQAVRGFLDQHLARSPAAFRSIHDSIEPVGAAVPCSTGCDSTHSPPQGATNPHTEGTAASPGSPVRRALLTHPRQTISGASIPLGPISIPPLRSDPSTTPSGPAADPLHSGDRHRSRKRVRKMFSRTVTVDLHSTRGPAPSRRDLSL